MCSKGAARSATLRTILERQPQSHVATAMIYTILQRQRAPMRFGNLARENEPDSGTSRLRRKERHKQICRTRQPRSLILNPDLQDSIVLHPTHLYATAGFKGS